MDLKLNNNSNLTLPVYNVVEYVESYGTPNIDTGVNITFSNTGYYTVEAVIEVLGGTESSSYIWYGNGAGDSYSIYLRCSESNTQFKARQYSKSGTDLDVEFTGKTEIKQGWGYIEINGVRTSTSSAGNNNRKGNLYLLYSGELKVRIWSFKMYNASKVLVRDFIPAVSLQAGHIGEPCLYDKVGNKCYYAGANGNFTASNTGFYDTINTLYIKNCSSINGIDVLRKSYNLERVRCDIGEATVHLSEIYKYSNLTGFNDSYEEQTKPRLVGTFNIDDCYSNSEVYGISERLDGTTINTPDSTQYDVEYLLENDQLAVQTLDSTKPNYNPAAAIILGNSSNYGSTLDEPLYSGDGKYSMKKSVAAGITSISTLFKGKTSVTDSNEVVSDDSTATYPFETFDELENFTGITTWTSGQNNGTFQGCTSLRKVTIPTDLGSVQYTFYGCTALEEIHFSVAQPSAGAYRYANCSHLTKIYFPTLDALLASNFSVYQSNTDVRGPFDVSKDGHIYIDGVELINLVVPSNFTIVRSVCRYAKSIESLEMLEGVTSIAAYAFYYCTALNSIIVPSTLTSTGDAAFSGCTSLVGGDVYYNGTLQQWMNITFDNTNATNATSPTGQGSHFYLGDTELTQLTIPEGTTAIKNKTFQGFRYITGSLTIPSSVVTIGTSSFRSMKSITQLNFSGNSLTSIGAYAFSVCESIANDIVLPNSVTTIGEYAFSGCSSLEFIDIPNSVTTIAQCAFADCTNLRSFINLTSCSYGTYAFNNCRNIEKIVINNSSSINYQVLMHIGTSSKPCELVEIKGTFSGNGNWDRTYIKKFIIGGNCGSIGTYLYSLEQLRVRGNISGGGGMGLCYGSHSTTKFVETMANYDGSQLFYSGNSNKIFHFGSDTVQPYGRSDQVGSVLVGNGISRQHDEDLLAQYMVASDWSAYSSKLATWYDYNGEYKWYYVTDNLTNCTNTNLVDWPYITRGESYQTTIVPDEGMTLDSVTVEMYEAVDNGVTPNTSTDITSSVYNSSTGEINISSVTGNIIITAKAS